MDTLLNLLKTLAPAVATAVAGPLGGVAITALASKFGVADSVAAVAEAIAGDPQAAQKLRELEFEYAKLDGADRSDARAMQVAALGQDDVFAKRFVYYFAAFWSVLAAVYIGFITFGQIPESNVRFADTILGFILGTVIATIMTYFFGSSAGSRDKSIQLAKGR
jgi:hypothetical protein